VDIGTVPTVSLLSLKGGWTLAHLLTFTRAHVHTCTRAHLYTCMCSRHVHTCTILGYTLRFGIRAR
jgi:hypothetical protein